MHDADPCPRSSRRIFLSAATVTAAAVTSELWLGGEADAQQSAGGVALNAPYGLDTVSRKVAKHGPVKCPKIKTVIHRGTHLKYHAPVKVYEGFRQRLELMELVIKQVAVRFYGRAPRRIRHLGSYNCRRISAYPEWISEHGLGNAIDIEGFDFPRLPTKAALPAGTPRMLMHPFSVGVLTHWKATRGAAGRHREFLHALARKLIARKDIFRVLLGPAFPGHANHFHFDVAPYRLVHIFTP